MTKKIGNSRYRRAIGLRYQGDKEDAPVITVKGEAFSADEIVKLAKIMQIPVVEEKELTEALDWFEIDDEIPPSLYETVAALFKRINKAF